MNAPAVAATTNATAPGSAWSKAATGGRTAADIVKGTGIPSAATTAPSTAASAAQLPETGRRQGRGSRGSRVGPTAPDAGHEPQIAPVPSTSSPPAAAVTTPALGAWGTSSFSSVADPSSATADASTSSKLTLPPELVASGKQADELGLKFGSLSFTNTGALEAFSGTFGTFGADAASVVASETAASTVQVQPTVSTDLQQPVSSASGASTPSSAAVEAFQQAGQGYYGTSSASAVPSSSAPVPVSTANYRAAAASGASQGAKTEAASTSFGSYQTTFSHSAYGSYGTTPSVAATDAASGQGQAKAPASPSSAPIIAPSSAPTAGDASALDQYARYGQYSQEQPQATRTSIVGQGLGSSTQAGPVDASQTSTVGTQKQAQAQATQATQQQTTASQGVSQSGRADPYGQMKYGASLGTSASASVPATQSQTSSQHQAVPSSYSQQQQVQYQQHHAQQQQQAQYQQHQTQQHQQLPLPAFAGAPTLPHAMAATHYGQAMYTYPYMASPYYQAVAYPAAYTPGAGAYAAAPPGLGSFGTAQPGAYGSNPAMASNKYPQGPAAYGAQSTAKSAGTYPAGYGMAVDDGKGGSDNMMLLQHLQQQAQQQAQQAASATSANTQYAQTNPLASQSAYPQQPYAMSHLSGGLYGQHGAGHGNSASAQYPAQGQSTYPQQYAAMHQGWGMSDRRGAGSLGGAGWDQTQ